jgi:hypothetical protein
MFNDKLNAHGGFTPAALAPPKYDNSREGDTALSPRSAGAVWGGQALSPPSYEHVLKQQNGENRGLKEITRVRPIGNVCGR